MLCVIHKSPSPHTVCFLVGTLALPGDASAQCLAVEGVRTYHVK